MNDQKEKFEKLVMKGEMAEAFSIYLDIGDDSYVRWLLKAIFHCGVIIREFEKNTDIVTANSIKLSCSDQFSNKN